MRLTTYKLELVKEKATNYGAKDYKIKNPWDVFDFLIDVYSINKQAEEVLFLICLDNKNKVVGCHEVSRGTINSSLVHPREIFKRALLNNANKIILTHNHPSGSLEPSREDISTTTRIEEAGKLMGIELLDHIIVGDSDCYSFKKEGRL